MSYIQIFGTLKDASFGGTNLSTKDYYIYDIRKPLIPEEEETTLNIPKRRGLISVNQKFIKNSLMLLGFMECTNYSDLKAKLKSLSAFLHSTVDKQLIPSDENDRYWNCRYKNPEIVGEKDNYALIDLTFICNDPMGYAITPDSKPDSPDDVITINDTTFIIANGGDDFVFPVVTITFNADQTHIYVQNNNIDGNRFDISKAFDVDDELEIDCKNGTIKLNGNYSPAGFGSGGQELAEWIVLVKGNDVIQVGTIDATIDITINLTFNKTYFY